MLQFYYDGNINTITATTNCIVDFALAGGGGGGGGSDAGHSGSSGVAGEKQYGQIYLSAGESIRCVVGSGGSPGESNARGSGGGTGGFSLFHWCGGTGGNAGPSGSSGAGGGGGGATVLQKADGSNICAAAGGGGGGGAGNYSNGYIRSNTFYLGVIPSYESGGKGQNKRGDGGGAGGGGGGYVSGAGGLEPIGDQGAMSGSNGSNLNLYPAPNDDFARSLSFDNYNYGWYVAGQPGGPGGYGIGGYAIFSSKQTDINIKQSGAWTKPQYISVRSNNAWREVTNAYVRISGSWVRVFGNNTPTASAVVGLLSNATGPMIDYPPEIVTPIYYNIRGGGRNSEGYAPDPNSGAVQGGWGYGNDAGGTNPGDPGGDGPGGDGPSA